MFHRDQLITRLGEIDAELTLLASYKRPSNAQVERAKALAAEGEEVRDQILEAETRQKQIRDVHDATPASERVSGSSFGVINRKSNAELFQAGRGSSDDALRALDIALESAVKATGKSSDLAREVPEIVRRRPEVADYLRSTSNPDYLSAFGKLLATGDASAVLRMNDGERAAFTAVAESESRASLALSDSAGGYAVPALLDPSVIYTGNGSANPMRQVSRIVTGVDDTWRGVSSAGITASWDAEAAEVSDDSPSLGQPTVTAYKGQAFVSFSVEIEGDWQGLVSEMAEQFAIAKDTLETTAHATGSGSQPQGVITALVASSGTIANVQPDTDGALFAADLYKLFGALPPRYRSNASWMMSLDAQNQVRTLGDDKLSNQTVDLAAGYSFQLLGRPVYDQSGFPDFTGTTGVANLMVVGDFRNFVIFDRVGSRIEIVPHLLHTDTNLPRGQRGAIFWWRSGSNVVNPNAFRLLRNT